jgi:CRP-like cAMP-binding protein
MANSISELLKASRLFSSLDEQTNNHLLPKFSKVELKHNEVLFYQGDPSDSIFFLVQGKLAAEFTNASGDSRIMGYIEPGESVGELGTLSNEPRSLTIKALKDAVLLRLPAQIFVTLCYQYPAVMFATVRPLIARSKNIIQMIGAEKSNKHVVIVPAHKDVSLEQFSQQLSGYIEKYGSVLLLSDYQEEFGNKNTESAATKEKIQRIVKSKNTVRRIIYVLQSYDTPLGKIALKKADMIFIVAHHDSKPKIDQSILDKIRSRRLHLAGDPGLLLTH